MRVDVDDRGDTKDTGTLAIYTQALPLRQYGDQVGLEWADIVDIHPRAIIAYAGYGTVEDLMAVGPQSSSIHLHPFADRRRSKARQRIRLGLRAVQNQGWAVNPAAVAIQKPTATRRA